MTPHPHDPQSDREKTLDEVIDHIEQVIENGKGITYNHQITYEWMYGGLLDHFKKLRQESKECPYQKTVNDCGDCNKNGVTCPTPKTERKKPICGSAECLKIIKPHETRVANVARNALLNDIMQFIQKHRWLSQYGEVMTFYVLERFLITLRQEGKQEALRQGDR